MLKGIDVSHHNGEIDWGKVKESGLVDFAILRTGFGRQSPTQVDKQFERNYVECKKYGIPVGAYHYSYSLTPADAELEAVFALQLIEGKQFEFPIFIDIEEKSQVALNRNVCSNIVKAFCDTLECKKCWAGVYSFDSFFKTNLNSEIPNRYATWVARVPSVDNGSNTVTPVNIPKARLDIHQFSWKGQIPGIKGDVDMNIAYKDFTPLVKNAQLNGYGVKTEDPEKKYTVIATQSGLTKDKAEDTSTYLKKLGMKVSVEGE